MRYLLTSLLCVFTLSLTAQEAGCTYPQADNYSSTATVDDGTCVFGSGLCGDGTMWNEDTQTCVINESFCSWQPDSNADGNVGITDLLDFLSVFGDTDSDSDGVWDSEDECIDLTACNYSAQPTEPCGLDADEDGVCDFYCGENTIYHYGYEYSTVLIGDQCWFSENCRYLPAVSPSSAYSETDPYYYVYDYQGTDVAASKATENYETYGVLYNWPALMIEGICPSGWHIPSDGEFSELTYFLGGESVAGGKMKEAGYDHWSSNTGATNSSGWTGLPGGVQHSGVFDSNGNNGQWWSASEAGSGSWKRMLSTNESVYRSGSGRNDGFSARCVRD